MTLFKRLGLARAWLGGTTSAVPGPTGLLLETTVRCNLRCPMCPRTLTGYPAEDLPDALLSPTLEAHAALGGDHVFLYGLGEPLLDRRIFRAVRHARGLGLTTILSTNGTLLDEDRREALLDSGCDHVLVSLDAATAATYAVTRPGGDFDLTVSRVQALAAEKARRRSRIQLVVQLVRLAANLHEQASFVRRWSSVAGVDQVRLKDEDIGLPGQALQAPDGLARRNPCHHLWRGPLVVRWNGDVFPCYHHAGHGRPLGNLARMSLLELWDHPELVRLREQHAAQQPGRDPLCATCPAVRPRRAMVLGAIVAGPRTTRRVLPVVERLALRRPHLLKE